MPSIAMMERSLGLKECPRCGLKNRGLNHQCDFCGYDFQSKDTWMENVKELEEINQLEKAKSLDTDTKTKIEATITNTAESEKKSYKGPLEKREYVVTVKSKSKAKITLGEQNSEFSADEEAAGVSRTVTEADAKVTPISSRGMNVFTANVPVDPLGGPAKPMSYLPPTCLVSIGSFVYAGTLLVAVSSNLSRLIGWVMVIIGALLIVTGVGWALKIRGPSLPIEETEGKNVLLCPICHEVVSKSDHECPKCHAAFEVVRIEEVA